MPAEFALCLLLLSAAPRVADPRVADPLATLDSARASLRSLTFDGVIETPKAGGRSGRFSMAFAFAAPDKYRCEIRMGVEGTITTIADGTFIWSIHSRTKKIHRQDQKISVARLKTLGPIDPVVALALPAMPLSSLFRLESARESGGVTILDLRPRKSVPNYDQILLSTSKDGRTPLSAETFQRGKRVARIIFSSFRRNSAVDASRFRYTPPTNSEIIPLR